MAGPNFDGLDTTTADIWPRRVYHLREEVICWVFWAGKFPEPPRGGVCLTEAGSFTGCRLQRGRLYGPSRLSKFSKRFVVYLSLHSGASTFAFEAFQTSAFQSLVLLYFSSFFLFFLRVITDFFLVDCGF